MANNYQTDHRNLSPNKIVRVQGLVTYSHIVSLIEGEELARANQRAMQRFSNYIEKERPYSQISIKDARVLYADENNPTYEERYAAERCKPKRGGDDPSPRFTATNSSRNLAAVAKRREDGKYEPVQLTGELAKDVKVTLVLRSFKGRGGNNGLGLNHVLIEDTGDIRYYGGSANVAELEKLGVIFTETPQNQKTIQGAASGEFFEDDDEPQPVKPEQTEPTYAPNAQHEAQIQQMQSAFTDDADDDEDPWAPNPF